MNFRSLVLWLFAVASSFIAVGILLKILQFVSWCANPKLIFELIAH